MKYYALLFVSIAAFVFITPFSYRLLPEGLRNDGMNPETAETAEEAPPLPLTEDEDDETEEKVCYLLSALLPEDTPAEALKAMAVVLRTNEKAGNGVSASPCAVPESVRDAVYATRGVVAEYDGEHIDAVYHIASKTMTESAADAYGYDVPYLVSVPTPEDADDFSSCASFTADEFARLLESNGITVYDSVGHKSWLTYVSRTPSDRIKRVFICGTELSGKEFSRILGFDSTCVTVETTDKGFVFTSYGNGDGVGLSVRGAIKMAQNGGKYDEMIAHYYPGVTTAKK